MNSNNFRKHGCGCYNHGSSGCHGVNSGKINCNVGPFRAIESNCLNPSCEFQTQTFINSTRINIPESGPATPYPSPIIVSGMTGNIIKVTVRLFNISHTFPSDISIMLVGPNGQNATIMSLIGRGFPVTNVYLTLDDLAPIAMSDDPPLISGTFKPTNAGAVFKSFPPGAPSPSGGSMLSSFNFTNPNGTWNLFVYDAAVPDQGDIAEGWELTITTSNCTP